MKNLLNTSEAYPCFCVSNEDVIRSILNFIKNEKLQTIIESTSSQVNQYGGYTKKTPKKFIFFIRKLIKQLNIPRKKILIGGDHLGPFPWKNEVSSVANKNSIKLILQCIDAGYKKIHIDTTYKLKKDNNFNQKKILKRTKNLMKLLIKKKDLIPVFGSEVPYPGSSNRIYKSNKSLNLLDKEIKFYFKNLQKLNLEPKFACVVEPGMYFLDKKIVKPNLIYLKKLNKFAVQKSIVYEAHSCDYQSLNTLKNLVKNNFKFLKVGPELTFNYSKAIFKMETVEKKKFLSGSKIKQTIFFSMKEDKRYWVNYYKGKKKTIEYLMFNSKLDRIRYYWDKKKVKKSLNILKTNINKLDKNFITKYFNISNDLKKKYEYLDNYDLVISVNLHKSISKFYSSCKNI